MKNLKGKTDLTIRLVKVCSFTFIQFASCVFFHCLFWLFGFEMKRGVLFSVLGSGHQCLINF